MAVLAGEAQVKQVVIGTRTGPGFDPGRLSCFSYFNRPSSNPQRDSQPVGRPGLLDLGLVDALAFELHRHVDSDLGRNSVRVEEVVLVDVDVDVDVVVRDAKVVGRRQALLLLRLSMEGRQSVADVVVVMCRRSARATVADAVFVVEDFEAVDVGLFDVVVGSRFRLFEAGAILTEPVERKKAEINFSLLFTKAKAQPLLL